LVAKGPRSITSIVFIVLLAALIIGVGDLTVNMVQSAMAGPG
jgi:hypothetical protein